MKKQLEKLVRNRAPLAARWMLAVFMFVPATLTAQSNDPPPIESTIHESANQAVIDEINAIRNQLGGGIGEQLKGLDLGNPLNAQLQNDFERELNRLATQNSLSLDRAPTKTNDSGSDIESTRKPKNTTNDGQAAIPREIHDKRSPVRSGWLPNQRGTSELHGNPKALLRSLEQKKNFMPSTVGSEFLAFKASITRPQASQIRPLRVAARRLDEIAAELEEIGLYAEADSVRQQAHHFWLKARRGEINNPQSTQPRNR